MRVELKIIYDTSLPPDRRFMLVGPIDDLILCYGLMGKAHDVIRDHNEGRRIVSPEKSNLPLPFGKG
jgi:hypothetical protein